MIDDGFDPVIPPNSFTSSQDTVSVPDSEHRGMQWKYSSDGRGYNSGFIFPTTVTRSKKSVDIGQDIYPLVVIHPMCLCKVHKKDRRSKKV